MDAFLAYLQTQWHMIVEAPLPFIVGWALFGALAYWWARHQFSDRLSTADDRIKFKDDQISSYREKLDGASPEEARAHIEGLTAEIDVLRAEIQALTPPPTRHLPQDALRSLKDALGEFSEWRIGVMPAENEECYDFAHEICAAIKECGLLAEMEYIAVGGADPRDRDLILYVYSDIEQNKAEAFQISLSAAIGLPCGLRRFGVASGNAKRLGRIMVNRPS